MKKVTNKELAQVFKDAKMHIVENLRSNSLGSMYICYAIRATDARYNAKLKAISLIEERIWPYTTLNEWLEFKLGKPRYTLPFRKVQQHRLSWLDLLYEEFKSK